MPWISYAQNGEDVRLRRAFSGQRTGFYIDVGANNPVENSVTKAFHEQGWSGINVEPLPALHALIAKDRPGDVNLNVGCSNAPGVLTLFSAGKNASGLSTFTEEEARIHELRGLTFDRVQVPVMTLAEICERHAKDRVIDFLSVDVEGHESQVLEGADFARFRPRVVVVEATRPNSTEPTHHRWEHLILQHDYSFVVFDGLNRFYTRREDDALRPALELAPNFFDDFIPYAYHKEISRLRSQVSAYRSASVVLTSAASVASNVRRVVELLDPRRYLEKVRSRKAE